MDRSVAKLTASLAATFGLLCAGNALAADSAEVAVAKDTATASVSPASEATGFSAMVVTANNRQTNLQKTPTALFVSGIEAKTKRRSQR